MVSIGPRPTYNLSSPADDWRAAADLPVSPLKNFAWQLEEGFLSSFGAGTIARDLMTPAGNTAPAPRLGIPIVDDVLAAGHTLRSAGEKLLGVAEPSMTPEQWKASPHYRAAIPFDPGMTESRAASLAAAFDIKQSRAYFAEKSPVTSYVGQFAGQMFDPINYVPVWGLGARVAAAAKFGIFGHIGLNASEAAINTAAFAMLTAEQRARFGDDIRWQTQINDVGMSALIGAVITPVLHGLGKGVELAEPYRQRVADRIRQGVETVQNVAASRSVLNNGAVSMVVDGEVKLTPADADVLTTMSTKVTAQRETAVSLKRETAEVVGDKAGKVVITPSGSRVEVKPEVVELADLLKAEGALQVRDRSRAASAAQIEDIAIKLDPARLMPSIEADRGAPIVGEDNIVDSGNGRVAAIRRAYEAYPEQAAAYRQAIEERGFPTDGMNQPVLISRRLTKLSPEARAQFNAEANTSATARMSATEIAAMDRGALDDATLALLEDGPISSAGNRAFVNRFLDNLPGNERAALHGSDGRLNADGERRIENALVAAAYGDVDAGVVARFAEATDDNSRAVVGALSDVAGRWALMRRAIKAGEISPEFDMTPELTTALRKLSGWREQAAREGRPVSIVIKEGMGQLDMLDGELPLETKTLVRMFYKTDEFKQSAGRDAISTRLGKIVDATNDLGRPQLFGDAAAATKLGVIENAIDDLEADLFAAERAGTGTDGIGPGRGQYAPSADRGNGAQGSQVGKGSIAGRMTERLVAAGRAPDEAAANAAIVDAFYTSMAERLGIPVAELEARHPLPEVRAGDMMDEAALAQSAPGNPAFDRWFGDSKVVDENGAPLTVYHGTADAPEAFDPAKRGASTNVDGAREAFWFSASPDNAAEFAGLAARRGAGASPSVMPVYLSMQYPLITDGSKRGDSFSETVKAAKAAGHDGVIFRGASDSPSPMVLHINGAPVAADPRGMFISETLPDFLDGKVTREEAQAELDAAVKDAEAELATAREGEDADETEFYEEEVTIWQAIRDAFASDPATLTLKRGLGPADVFAVFEPTQVKSKFNRGTFDPADPRLLFQPAYHGTPHIFDKFDSSKIGTGEGAQAFGHGLYFAGRKEVAQYYRDALAVAPALDESSGVINNLVRGGQDNLHARLDLALENAPALQAAMSPEIRKLIVRAVRGAEVSADTKRTMQGIAYTDDAVKALSDLDTLLTKNNGRLLTVDIPGDDELLVWDAPLSEQPPKVKEALRKSGLFTDGEIEGRVEGSPDYVASVGKLPPLTGADAYNQLAAELARSAPQGSLMDRVGTKMNDDVAASAALREAGIPGHRFLDQGSRPSTEAQALIRAQGSREKALTLARQRADEASIPRQREEWQRLVKELERPETHNYVIYDDSRINVTGFEQPRRGQITMDDSGSVITLFKTADASTAAHEFGHHFLTMFKSLAEADGAPLPIARDWETIKGWWASNADQIAAESPADGVTGADVAAVLRDGTSGDRVKDLAINVGLQEQWARGFESYLYDGMAPTSALARVFEQFKNWLREVYRAALDLKVNVSPELKGVFDRMLGGDQPRKTDANYSANYSDPMPALDFTSPTPEPPVDGLDTAAQLVGHQDTPQSMREMFGLKDDGSFDEQADIDQYREMGILDEQDEAMLKLADDAVKAANAYEETLRVAASCVAGSV